MWLMKKSRKVTFVDSNMRDDRVSLPKNEKQLSDMNDKTPDKITLQEVLEQTSIPLDTYLDALKFTHHDKSVVLKRNPTDAYTNGCNHNILLLWGANIDFQFVLDEYSTIMYACSYMIKSEKAMGEVLKSVARECHSEPLHNNYIK